MQTNLQLLKVDQWLSREGRGRSKGWEKGITEEHKKTWGDGCVHYLDWVHRHAHTHTYTQSTETKIRLQMQLRWLIS